MIIADTGSIVALINPRDQHHQWARAAIRQINEPMLTCDAVLSATLFPRMTFSLLHALARESQLARNGNPS
jgi:predicted nucleic acid-binding protein